MSGSPPRLWGIREVVGVLVGAARFTPTPVGNTGQPGRSSGKQSVHPHACGEYAVSPDAAAAVVGSPPRLWGIRCTPAARP